MEKFIEINSIKLPGDFSKKRDLRYDTRHLDGSRLDAYDLEQYDNDSIFYDVFFDISNRFLYTVGPPFLNLQRFLFPITCRINNDREKYLFQVDEYFDRNIAIGKLSLKDLALYDENIIEFDFNKRFQWCVRIGLNRSEIKPVIVTTIQKDNRIKWIMEWIDYYSQNYGIDQTIIYDNNSSNRGDLKSISDDRLMIVAWDFKYGPTRSHANQFCQLGSLNHCRLKFGANNIIMNFDIDELLYLNNSKLRMYFKRYNLMIFDGYRVPFIKPITEDFSYADFSFRDKRPQQGGLKYFYKPRAVVANNIHDALLEGHQGLLLKKLRTRYYRLCNAQKNNRIYKCLLDLMAAILKLKIANVNEAYFLHFIGITTNWKSIYWDRRKETIPSDNHIRFKIQ